MEKISIIGLLSEKETIIDSIQDFSFAEIIDTKSILEQELKKDIYFEGKEEEQFENAELKYAIDFLNTHYLGKKPGLLESFIGNKIKASKKDIELSQTIEYKEIINKLKNIDQKIISINSQTDKINQELNLLDQYKNIKFHINSIFDLSNYKLLIGQMPSILFENLHKEINKITNLTSINTLNSPTEKTRQFYIIIPSFAGEENINQINKILTQYKFQNADFLLKYPKSPHETVDDLLKEKRQLNIQKNNLIKNIQDYMPYRLPLMCLYDQKNWTIQAKENLGKSIQTEKSFILLAWIPSKKIKQLQSDLEKISQNFHLAKLSIEKNESPPVKLENPKYIQPFEAVTNIYGMPKYSEPDPTIYLSIFFIIFLALCLTDAGYGIVMIILTYLMLKYVDLPDKRLVTLLNYGGWVTLVIGALCGGWFGVDLNAISTTPIGSFLLRFRLIDPINDPITLMIVALLLGITHVWFGIFVKFISKIKNNNHKDAWLDDFPWLYFIASLMIFILGQVQIIPAQIGLYILYSGVGIIALTQGRSQKNIFLKIPAGIFKLYDTIGYLSDTLSYSRLLALGLATAIIGLVVNMIADLFKGIPVIGIIIFIIVLIAGHLFNLAINLLGAFIHSARLQYVEFFTKFLEGGGRRFEPLKKDNVYTNIKN